MKIIKTGIPYLHFTTRGIKTKTFNFADKQRNTNTVRLKTLFVADEHGDYVVKDESMLTDGVLRKIKNCGYTIVDDDKKEIVKEEPKVYNESNKYICSHCGFEARTKAGLAVHHRFCQVLKEE